MNYSIIRTDTADAGIRSIILYIARAFGNEVALEKLEYLEKQGKLNYKFSISHFINKRNVRYNERNVW